MNDLLLPPFTSVWSLLITFALALLVLDLCFVRWRPLTKLTWKKVDYVWLAFALFGIVGSVVSARIEVAKRIGAAAHSRLRSAADQVENRLAFGLSPAVCRSFVKSDLSPPTEVFERIQREYDEECRWFRAVSERIRPTIMACEGEIQTADLGVFPTGGDQWAVSSLRESVRQYNQSLASRRELAEAVQRSTTELSLSFCGPFLLVFALALRITKVTAEIRIERGGMPS